MRTFNWHIIILDLFLFQTDDSDKVSIGIVIAVAIIAAIIFFVIGFIVSKYCRRRRQEFKMMNVSGFYRFNVYGHPQH